MVNEQILKMLRGFTFNGIHNSDMGVVMNNMNIEFPSKKKIKESVPFMNGSYDFSTVGSFGEIVYEQRKITIGIGIPSETKEKLQSMYSKILEWIIDAGKQKLIFDVIPDYYFLAEVEESGSLSQVMEYGELSLTFVADPFKISVLNIGNDIWDTFNFEEDYAADTFFNIKGTNNIKLYNPGRPVKPVITSTSAFTMDYNGKTYQINTGVNKVYGLYLQNGDNDIKLTGTGNIRFDYNKEML